VEWLSGGAFPTYRLAPFRAFDLSLDQIMQKLMGAVGGARIFYIAHRRSSVGDPTDAWFDIKWVANPTLTGLRGAAVRFELVDG